MNTNRIKKYTCVISILFALLRHLVCSLAKGETRQTILVRLHPDEQRGQKKQVFHVDLKSPTGTMLDVNRRATVVIRRKWSPFFSFFLNLIWLLILGSIDITVIMIIA